MQSKKKKLKLGNVAIPTLGLIIAIFLAMVSIRLLRGPDKYYKIVERDEQIKEYKDQDGTLYETIGWAKVQGTNIDYPVFGIVDDNYTYPVTQSYLWSINEDRDFHNVMMLYGHNVMNLGPAPKRKNEDFIRLEELMSFVYYDFAQENKYIQYTTNGKDYLYKIFAVNFIFTTDYNEYPEGEFSQGDRDDYVSRLLKESIYDYDVAINDDDNIISVATCTRFFGDGEGYYFIVSGRQVRADEKIDNYEVKKNANYKKINNILKGVDEDEESEDI